MDRSLDEVISERQPTQRDYTRDLDNDWVHDKFDDVSNSRRPRDNGRDRNRIIDRYEPNDESTNEISGKIRVDNLHYDLNEDDLRELFTRIGPITDCEILYDRSDRSRGTAYVTYVSMRDAHRAIREYDGANAYKQPIRLTLQPSGSGGGPRGAASRNPFDTVQLPGRSLFDRIEDSQGRILPRERRRRSDSPPRRSDVRKPPPDGIDRYVPSDRRSERSRSPLPRRNGGNRRPGTRRDDHDRARSGRGRDRDGRPRVQGRPRKTATELDAEMEDYWGVKEGGATGSQTNDTSDANGSRTGPANTLNDDIDMIE